MSSITHEKIGHSQTDKKETGALAKPSFEENWDGKSVSKYDYESHHSVAHSPEGVPSVEVHSWTEW